MQPSRQRFSLKEPFNGISHLFAAFGAVAGLFSLLSEALRIPVEWLHS